VILNGIANRPRRHRLRRKLSKKLVDRGIGIEADLHGIRTQECSRENAAWQSLDVVAFERLEHRHGNTCPRGDLTKRKASLFARRPESGSNGRR
jgi:hypothetical protein